MAKEAIEFDDERSLPSDKALRRISLLADQQVALEDDVALLEEQLKKKKEVLRQVAEVDLPEAMASVGMKKCATTHGFSISVSTDYYASLTGKYRVPAMAWLRKNGYESLIQRVVGVKFGKGEERMADWLLDQIKKRGSFKDNPIINNEEVNTGSFKAAVRECLKAGKNVPLADLGVNEVTCAKIERTADK